MSNNDVNASSVNTKTDGSQSEVEVLTKRLKDAQAALTPLQQDRARLKAELEASKTPPKVELSPEREKELEDLKFTDPDQWRQEVNKLDEESQQAFTQKVDEETKKIQDQQAVVNFLADNPTLDKDLVKNVIPTAIQERYSNGEITMQEVLEIGKKLINGAPVASIMIPDSPNIGAVAGSDKPTNEAKQKQVEVDWTNTLV